MQKIENLKMLPKISDSISYLYVEKCKIEQDSFAIKVVYLEKEVSIPCANLTVLFIGPGVSITHAAIISLSYAGCLIIWCGENLRRFYAHGYGETKSAKNILKQAYACFNNDVHLKIVQKMYKLRFPYLDMNHMNLEQMRGLEGVRMRTTYNMYSKQFNIPWNGRNLKGIDYTKMDLINKGITYNNSLLYSICLGVIITLGYSSAIGFIHVGNINSFIYDIANLYKCVTSIPSAFETLSKLKSENKIQDINNNIGYFESELRKNFRSYVYKNKLLSKIVSDLNYLFHDVEIDYGNNTEGALWDFNKEIDSNKNYG